MGPLASPGRPTWRGRHCHRPCANRRRRWREEEVPLSLPSLRTAWQEVAQRLSGRRRAFVWGSDSHGYMWIHPIFRTFSVVLLGFRINARFVVLLGCIFEFILGIWSRRNVFMNLNLRLNSWQNPYFFYLHLFNHFGTGFVRIVILLVFMPFGRAFRFWGTRYIARYKEIFIPTPNVQFLILIFYRFIYL